MLTPGGQTGLRLQIKSMASCLSFGLKTLASTLKFWPGLEIQVILQSRGKHSFTAS